jgi:dynein heavy chain
MVTKVDEVQQLLDDQIVKAQTMKGSPFARPFMDDGDHMEGFKGIGSFETQLSFTQDLMDEWLKVQATYMYLEPIFSSPDIKAQLPQEGERFKKVDKSWRDMMKTALAAPLVLDIVKIEGIMDNLTFMNVLLDKIQKGLNAYLEQKRLYFPRFFFLSADELLEILAENSDPRRVQPHIKKSFEGVDKLTFDDDLNIMEIISPQSEVLTLNQSGEVPINPSGGKGVEIWLEELEQYMRRAVHDTHIAAMLDYESDETGAKAGKKTREEWVGDWPGQVVLVISQLHFCKEVEYHVERAGPQGLKELTQLCSDRIFNIVNLVRSKIPKLLQRTCGALIVIDVHAKECLEQISATMTSKNAFDWTQQLRYYYEADTVNEWENNGLIVAKMLNSRLQLEGEYVGNIDEYLDNIQCSEIFTLIYEKLHTEA